MKTEPFSVGRPAGRLLLVLGVFLFPLTAFGQFDCGQPPDAGKNALLFQTTMWLPPALGGDLFQCGTAGNETPATCELYNRAYTNNESACVNTETDATIDFLPIAYSGGSGTNQRYESDLISPPQWPGPLGADGETWYILWDHLANPGTADCIGYYAAQVDILQFGEWGNPRFYGCDGLFSNFISCTDPVNQNQANTCNPQLGTVLGEVDNIGGMGPVPVPAIVSTTGESFTDPVFSVELSWLSTCATSTNDGALDPVMGYRLEAFFDANSTGTAEFPATCDQNSDLYIPVLDIATVPDSSDTVPDMIGDGSVTTVVLTGSNLMVPGTPLPGAVEGLTFRLRILYRDDRESPQGLGGIDGIIDPILSLPSLRSATLAVFGECIDGDGDDYGAPGDVSCPAGAETDCDDTDPAINPGATEIRGNPLDEDCDGEAVDADGDGVSIAEGDCDDFNPAIHPGLPDIPDGLDNDCDGTIDELSVEATCEITPSSINLQSQGMTFSINTSLNVLGTGDPLDPSAMSPVFISRISSPGVGNIILPVPRAEPGCNDLTEDGLWENVTDRSVTGAGTATLRFNMPADGNCETRDGNRQDLIALMLDIPDGETATVCYRSTHPSVPDSFECCGPVTVTNHGNR